MAAAQTEPSMDEILASIRRIISEEDGMTPDMADREDPLELSEADEAPVAKEVVAEVADPEPQPIAEAEDNTEDDLTIAAEVDAPAEDEPHPVDDFSDPPEPVSADAGDELMTEETAPMAHANGVAAIEEDAVAAKVAGLVGSAAASQAAEAFGQLESNVRVSNGSGRTVEDVIEAMLAPMLKEWLDANLPRIVEEKVEEEVRRIARR